MTSAFQDLYKARIEYAWATPGSREWWQAIRKIWSARRRIRDAFGVLFDIVRGIVEAASGTLRSLANAIPDTSLLL